MPQKKLHIAMLEDDSDDRYLTKELTEELGFDLEIDFFSNSDELIFHLKKHTPQLILVDYNSTPANGSEVLKRLKTAGSTSHIPVVVLSESLSPTSIRQCYESGASAFVIKPSSFGRSKEKIKAFFTYWTEVAEL